MLDSTSCGSISQIVIEQAARNIFKGFIRISNHFNKITKFSFSFFTWFYILSTLRFWISRSLIREKRIKMEHIYEIKQKTRKGSKEREQKTHKKWENWKAIKKGREEKEERERDKMYKEQRYRKRMIKRWREGERENRARVGGWVEMREWKIVERVYRECERVATKRNELLLKSLDRLKNNNS